VCLVSLLLAAAGGCTAESSASSAAVRPTARALETPSPAGTAPSALKPFVYQSPTAVTITTLPVWVALASGYFRDEGLDVTLVAGSGSVGISAVLSGDVQVGGSGDSGIRAAFQGAPLKVIAAPAWKPQMYLYSRPEFTDVSQLRGASIAIPEINSTTHRLGMKILQEVFHWPDPARDAQWVRVRGQSAQALAAGTVEAAVVSAPEDAFAAQLGMRQLFYVGDYVTMPVGGMVVTADYLSKNQDDLKHFLTAMLRGLRQMHAAPAFTIAVLEQRLDMDHDVASTLYENQIASFGTDGMVSESAMAFSLEESRATLDSVTRELKPSDVFDFSLIGSVARQLDASGWTP
jgi:ABC-type nitrate/sulfonate/bicarbonate transport system substrate-binding protein